MLARTLIAAAAVTVSLASLASAAPRVIVTGSHNPAQGYIVVDKAEEPAPYTLAGREVPRTSPSSQGQVTVGNRVLVPASR